MLTANGRLDAHGAIEFDEVWQSVPADVSHIVIDLTQVSYLSSIGIRSLVSVEKTLRTRHGNAVLAGATKFVFAVLETTGLLREFQVATDLNEAKQHIRQAVKQGQPSFERTNDGRHYRFSSITEEPCFIDLWGSLETFSNDARTVFAVLAQPGSSAPVGATAEELGLAFGNGALGDVRSWSPDCSGPFFAAGNFVAVLPRNGNGASDFILSDRPEELELSVSKAAGFSGPASVQVELASPLPVPLATVLQDLRTFLSEHKGSPVEVLGFVLRERSGPGSLMAGIASADQLWGTHVRYRGAPTATPQLKDLEGIAELTGKTLVQQGSISVFLANQVRPGSEKLLRIEVEDGAGMKDEWYQIIRRLYRDCSRVVLTRLTGGYMATTLRVVSYDKEGRRLLPTVTKIATPELIEREESAHRTYVQRFILNNSTTIMGTVTAGSWAALRYNFLGISGPNSTLSWMEEHYHKRPAEEVQQLFSRLYTQILKPWYGQPRWEAMRLYEEHTPLRLFPHLCEHAERDFGFSPDAERIECAELGITFANPFRFLRTEYRQRSGRSRLWYQSVTHGDLNLRNILVDQHDNLYVIDFSETRLRNIVSDFARMEAILKFQTTRVETAGDVARLVEFEMGLAEMRSMGQPPNRYAGDDPQVAKAYQGICQLRKLADTATLFETDVAPYWLALLEWTFSVLSYDLGPLRRKLAAYSAAILCEQLQEQ